MIFTVTFPDFLYIFDLIFKFNILPNWAQLMRKFSRFGLGLEQRLFSKMGHSAKKKSHSASDFHISDSSPRRERARSVRTKLQDWGGYSQPSCQSKTKGSGGQNPGWRPGRGSPATQCVLYLIPLLGTCFYILPAIFWASLLLKRQADYTRSNFNPSFVSVVHLSGFFF